MGENTEELVVSLENSLSSDICDTVGDLAEVGLDAVMDDGILKDIPILSTVVGLYRIGYTIRGRHEIKQLALFVAELNRGCTDESKRKQLLKKLNSDTQKSKQEIEYILVVLDSYLEYEKPEMLAKLYMAYLEQRIDWTPLVCMQMESAGWLRLLSAGFVYEQWVMRFNDGMKKNENFNVPYSITETGQKFVDIVG